MTHYHVPRINAFRVVSAFIAFVALVSSVLTVGLQNVAGAASVTSSFAAGEGPLDIAINSAGTYAYVANFTSDTVSVIDLSNDSVVATISVGTNPSRVVLDPSNTHAYVSNYTSSTVSVITLSSNAVTATVTLPTGSDPEQIAVTSTDAYVADRGTNSISVVDLSTNTLIAPLTPGNGPEGIVLSATDAYVTNRTDGTVSVIKLSDGSLVATIPVGAHDTRIAINPAGTDVYVTNNTPDTVSVIQTSSNTVVATIPVGSTPDAVAIDPTGTHAYVSDAGSPPAVSVIQLSTNTVVQTITVGSAPEGIAVNPGGTLAYVVNYSSNNVSVISIANHTVTFGPNLGAGTMQPEVASVPTALTPNVFSRAGYSFSGWNTAADGSGTTYANGATYPFASSATLYAQWSAAVASYTVTFNANRGAGTMASETASTPTVLTPNAFSRARYIFNGWNTAANGKGTAYADGATYPFTASATLYAQWTKKHHENKGRGH